MKSPEIILIRGLPGSGKTTMAKTMYSDYVLCEADQYFELSGTYLFNASKLPDAHKYCYDKAVKFLNNGFSVVVANTFTRIWEMQKYLDLPYKITVIEATGKYPNIHNVPSTVIKTMEQRYEHYED